MPKFVTMGYGDRAGYDRTDAAIRDAAHAHDAKLRQAGVVMGIAGAPVQVRNHDAARVQTAEGQFLYSSLPVAGFAVIEAGSIDEAIQMVSQTPCAVAHGVVEVWPLEETPTVVANPSRLILAGQKAGRGIQAAQASEGARAEKAEAAVTPYNTGQLRFAPKKPGP